MATVGELFNRVHTSCSCADVHPPEPIENHCAICVKTFPSRKSYTDHRRAMHGLYYVTCSSLCIPVSPLLVTANLPLVLGGSHLLTKDKPAGSFLCHLCLKSCGRSCDTIKVHYTHAHKLPVAVDIGYPRIPSPHPLTINTTNPFTPSSPNQNSQPEQDLDSEMAEITPTGDDGPQVNMPDLSQPFEPEDDNDSDWEVGTSYSDSEADADDEEDLIVPRSFNLPTSASPSFEDLPEDGPLTDDEMEESSEAPGDEDPSVSNSVFASNSRSSSSPTVSIG